MIRIIPRRSLAKVCRTGIRVLTTQAQRYIELYEQKCLENAELGRRLAAQEADGLQVAAALQQRLSSSAKQLESARHEAAGLRQEMEDLRSIAASVEVEHAAALRGAEDGWRRRAEVTERELACCRALLADQSLELQAQHAEHARLLTSINVLQAALDSAGRRPAEPEAGVPGREQLGQLAARIHDLVLANRGLAERLQACGEGAQDVQRLLASREESLACLGREAQEARDARELELCRASMGALHADIVALAEAFEAEKAGIAAEADACVRAAQESAARSERLLMLRTKELNTVRHLLTRQRALQHAAQTAAHGKA
ncbi:hypothetical protein F751_2145 [Auxenochlorella protothecoides]|uniref:Uncharacterized protein n=1 Tax=Auxenochlorella protothecoides TaxID=3075 RepID=A0A087SLF4_AUXPR|nr:hypothetical protein F751_2145 [Auxenochlorella protothecoides]KFM26558.1 hypothetical protein F751_2145 [Auxenochlorella protothecoides]